MHKLTCGVSVEAESCWYKWLFHQDVAILTMLLQGADSHLHPYKWDCVSLIWYTMSPLSPRHRAPGFGSTTPRPMAQSNLFALLRPERTARNEGIKADGGP